MAFEFCNTCDDTPVQPEWNSCDFSTKEGGIPHLVFLRCTKNYVHPNEGGWANLDNWIYAICNGVLFFTGKVLGERPKGSATKKKLSSCEPEMVVSKTNTLNFKDYNSDKVGFTDVDFWNGIEANKKSLLFGQVLCDDTFYMESVPFDIEIHPVTEPNNTDNHYYDGTITWIANEITKPILVPGLNEFLNEYKNSVDCYGG